jgi:hypothetical protein
MFCNDYRAFETEEIITVTNEDLKKYELMFLEGKE